MSKEVLVITEENVAIKNKKLDKMISNINVKQCITTIIFCSIMLLLLLIPYSFGAVGVRLTAVCLPFIGDGLIITNSTSITNGLSSILGLDAAIMDILSLGLQYYILAFFTIILADIVFSALLAIFRFNGFRTIFKFFSIIFGIAMIAIFLLSILHIVGIVGHCLNNGDFLEIVSYVESNGILIALAILILSLFIAIKQFRWFAKYW